MFITGYSLGFCNSCETLDNDQAGECKLGCMFSFDSSMKPVPPAPPTPPAARPEPPICGVFPSMPQDENHTYVHSGCTSGETLNFSNVFSSHAVLQMAPARAAVYGYVVQANHATHIDVHLQTCSVICIHYFPDPL